MKPRYNPNSEVGEQLQEVEKNKRAAGRGNSSGSP
jgi:hypothetical protein